MTKGTTPVGAANEAEASRWVREMFGRIAPRYDLLNHLLSFNIDRLWRRRLIRRVRPILDNPSARVLDLCCGTGDVMAAMKQARARIYGSDFAHPMLTAANRKSQGMWRLFEADGLAMPLADGSFDLVTIAFGFRNFANYRGGLMELRRVIRPGGRLAILEFCPPPKTLFGRLHGFYSRTVLPKVGGLISGSREAYQYLPSSVENFPVPSGLADLMRDSGFGDVRYELMTGGTVALHVGS
ncbi:MAG TPA: ubiquinone/menaquinone biosynthesis methyltransferase [Bryobacteraceae bacterium]|nr:ubiquinone/menaquinone biosynthesis methyltransferase [Bryobacteraceae bacterium]